MKYWVIRHDIVDEYFTGNPARRWGRFDRAKQFGTKEAASMAADTLFAGACKILEVTDELPEYMTPSETLPEWYAKRLAAHIANQKQFKQGLRDESLHEETPEVAARRAV